MHVLKVLGIGVVAVLVCYFLLTLFARIADGRSGEHAGLESPARSFVAATHQATILREPWLS